MNPETKLRNKILAYLNSLPESDFEISPPGSRSGKHDITGCLRGRYCSFEVKTKTGRPTKLQLYEARRKRYAGAVVAFVRSVDDVKLALKEQFEPEFAKTEFYRGFMSGRETLPDKSILKPPVYLIPDHLIDELIKDRHRKETGEYPDTILVRK